MINIHMDDTGMQIDTDEQLTPEATVYMYGTADKLYGMVYCVPEEIHTAREAQEIVRCMLAVNEDKSLTDEQRFILLNRLDRELAIVEKIESFNL